jgi:hypothetical protein
MLFESIALLQQKEAQQRFSTTSKSIVTQERQYGSSPLNDIVWYSVSSSFVEFQVQIGGNLNEQANRAPGAKCHSCSRDPGPGCCSGSPLFLMPLMKELQCHCVVCWLLAMDTFILLYNRSCPRFFVVSGGHLSWSSSMKQVHTRNFEF